MKQTNEQTPKTGFMPKNMNQKSNWLFSVKTKCSVKGGIPSKFGVKIVLTTESYTETDYVIFKGKGIHSVSLPLTHHSEKFFQKVECGGEMCPKKG